MIQFRLPCVQFQNTKRPWEEAYINSYFCQKQNKQAKTQKEKEKRRYRIKCTGRVLEEHSSDTLIIKLLEYQMINKIFGANKQKGIMPEGGEPWCY